MGRGRKHTGLFGTLFERIVSRHKAGHRGQTEKQQSQVEFEWQEEDHLPQELTAEEVQDPWEVADDEGLETPPEDAQPIHDWPEPGEPEVEDATENASDKPPHSSVDPIAEGAGYDPPELSFPELTPEEDPLRDSHDWDTLEQTELPLTPEADDGPLLEEEIEAQSEPFLPETKEGIIPDDAAESILVTVWPDETDADDLSEWGNEWTESQDDDPLAQPAFHDPFLEDELDLHDFREDARQNPWEQDVLEDETPLRKARGKAAKVVNLLEVAGPLQRQAAIDYLTELFQHLTHSATFRAIEDLGREGIDLETLQAVVDLRHYWMQRDDWWLVRHAESISKSPSAIPAFTWKLSYRVYLARSDYPIEMMIDDNWLEEWQELPPGVPGYLNFTSFIAEKVSHANSERLYSGLLWREQAGTKQDVNDRYDWPQRVSGNPDVLAQLYPMITPYDDRPGAIQPGSNKGKEESK